MIFITLSQMFANQLSMGDLLWPTNHTNAIFFFFEVFVKKLCHCDVHKKVISARDVHASPINLFT